MSKNSHKALASATVMSLVLTSTLAATNVQAAAEVTRMPGADRYTTAQTVAKKSFGKAENVVLVNGLGYADSVSATPFAKLKNAPILLTDAEDKPSADLLATLTELGAKNIYIVGGKGVVTEAMEKELAKNYTVERIGGTSRYETNAEIAKKVIAETKAEKAILVNGQDGYADALSVASVAATKGYPVIFGNKNNVPAVVKDAVKDVKEILAVGGEGVLPDAVIKTVEAKRIAKGADRFDTNLKVLEHFDGDFNFENIFVAAGGDDSTSKFADALVASAAAAKHGAPVVLTGLGANKDNVDKSVKYIKDKMGDNTKVTIVGGTASVSDAIEKDIKGEKESTGKAEVQSIEAINLNQIKIVFATKVNDDTAETVSNYEVDGNKLELGDAHAALKDDDRTVILTLKEKESQNKDKMVKVRKGILTEDKSKIVEELEKKITFKDIVAPTVEKVEAKGNNKLTVEFSEAVYVKADTEKAAVETLAQELEINDQTIYSLGYNNDDELSVIKEYVKSGEGFYLNKVEFYFDSALDSGTNKLTVPDGSDTLLIDAAGFTIKEKTIDFKVDEVTGKPKVKSIKGGTDGNVYINFDRPMDKKTAKKKEYYRLNDSKINSDAKIDLKEKDTQVKISGLKDVLTGSNTISIENKVKDAYGNKVEDDLRVAFTAEKDEVKPKVNYVLSVDDNTIRVVFNKDVLKSVAENKNNYTLKDSQGTKIDIDNPVSIEKDIYDIKLSNKKKLDGSKYTLKIENIIDLAGNIMDDYTATINGSDIVPSISKAVKVSGNKHKVVIVFDQEMKSSSVNKLENYKYKNGDNEVKSLPSDSKISVASDNKTVTIEFPTSYRVKDGDENSNYVKNIIVTKNVQSVNGVSMDADETVNIEGTLEITLANDPITLKEDGDDAIVVVRFNGAVKEVDKANFEFTDNTLSAKASSVNVKGEVVEFRFTSKDAENVKAMGVDLKIKIKGNEDKPIKNAIKDYSENGIGDTALKDAIENAYVNTNEITPKLEYTKTNGYVDWKTDIVNDTMTIKFNTKLDEDLKVAYKDDFTFVSNKNSELDIEGVVVEGNTITYKFKQDIKNGEEITIKAIENPDIRTKKDDNGDGDALRYKPESVEKNEGLKVKVTGTDEEVEAEQVAAANKAIDEAKTLLEDKILGASDDNLLTVLNAIEGMSDKGVTLKVKAEVTDSTTGAKIDNNGVVTKGSAQKQLSVTIIIEKDKGTAEEKAINITVPAAN